MDHGAASLHVQLREARLAQIEAIETALDCAERALTLLADDWITAIVSRRIADARVEADRLHHAFNRLGTSD